MKLEQGQVIKNYKELCKLLNIEVKTGNSKIAQMKELERYYKFSKQGYKIIVDEVYTKPKPKIDDRVNNGQNFVKYYPQYHVDEVFNKFIGVYKITYNKSIYIGSTTNNFRERFTSHMNTKSIPEIYNILQKGAKFEIIWSCEKGEYSEEYIRNKENKYIEIYKNDKSWDIINVRNAWNYESKHKNKYIAIRIEKEYYDEIIELLDKHGYECKLFHNKKV